MRREGKFYNGIIFKRGRTRGASLPFARLSASYALSPALLHGRHPAAHRLKSQFVQLGASFSPHCTQNRAKRKALSCNCAQCGVQSKQNTMVKGLNVHACTNAGIRPERRQRIRSEGGGLRGDGDAGAGDYRAAGRVGQGEPRPRERRHRQQRIYHAHFAPDGESCARRPAKGRPRVRFADCYQHPDGVGAIGRHGLDADTDAGRIVAGWFAAPRARRAADGHQRERAGDCGHYSAGRERRGSGVHSRTAGLSGEQPAAGGESPEGARTHPRAAAAAIQ